MSIWLFVSWVFNLQECSQLLCHKVNRGSIRYNYRDAEMHVSQPMNIMCVRYSYFLLINPSILFEKSGINLSLKPTKNEHVQRKYDSLLGLSFTTDNSNPDL